MSAIERINKHIAKAEQEIEEIEEKIKELKKKAGEKKITPAESEKQKMKYQSEIIAIRGRIKRLTKIRLNIEKKHKADEEEEEEYIEELAEEGIDEKEERKSKLVGNALIIIGIVGMALTLSWDLIKEREISYGMYAYSSMVSMLIIWILGLVIIWFASRSKYLLARKEEV